MENKKLHRIADGQMLCGVCTGLADYLNLDVTIIRLIAAASCFFGGSGILAYIVAAVIMPEDENKQWK